MEEVNLPDRKRKTIFLHIPHVPQKIIKEKLFSSVEVGLKVIKKAIKGGGVLIHSLRDDCKYFCIFL